MIFITKITKNDAAVKNIFDNIRNLGLCAVIFGAGAWKAKHLANGWLYYLDYGLSWFLFIAGWLLMWINLDHGLIKIKEATLPRWMKALLGGLYAGLGVQVVFLLLESRLVG